MKWIFTIFQNFVHWALKWLRKHILKKTESLYNQELYLLTIENEHITYLEINRKFVLRWNKNLRKLNISKGKFMDIFNSFQWM